MCPFEEWFTRLRRPRPGSQHIRKGHNWTARYGKGQGPRPTASNRGYGIPGSIFLFPGIWSKDAVDVVAAANPWGYRRRQQAISAATVSRRQHLAAHGGTIHHLANRDGARASSGDSSSSLAISTGPSDGIGIQCLVWLLSCRETSRVVASHRHVNLLAQADLVRAGLAPAQERPPAGSG